jgi:ubiquinone/menaquinone biosynthesis C-methylase UbiE
MSIQKQVNKAHYDFGKYVDKERWNSFYHQIGEIINAEPKSILEVGVGSGISKCVLKDFLHYNYESMDIDEELYPDHTGSVLDMPFVDRQYDVIGCFQVLEHLPFKDFEKAISELFRVANKAVILSLPNAEPYWQVSIPRLMRKKLLKKPFVRLTQHVFDGEHYWEINKKGYELHKIKREIEMIGNTFNFHLKNEYRVYENPYHHFFVLER